MSRQDLGHTLRRGARFSWQVACWAGLVAGLCLGAAAEPSVTVEADRVEVKVNDLFWLTLTAQGSNIEDPVLPEGDGFQIDSARGSRRSSTSMQRINNRPVRVSQRQWRYRAWATRPGVVKIPPIRVRIDDTDCKTGEVVLHVTAAGDAASAPVELPAQQAPAEETAKVPPTLDDAVIIESTVDKRSVYQGEAVELQLQILTLNLPGLSANYSGRSIPLPATEGFYVGPVHQETETEERKGWPYRVQRVRQFLFPTGVGDLVVGSWAWQGEVWGNTRQGLQHKFVSLSADPVDIKVKPLPDRPPDFSGAVGTYVVRANVLDTNVVQGTPTQMVFRVQGQGNPDAIGPPVLPEMAWAHLSEPEPEKSDGSEGDWAQITKSFTYTLTPLEAGELEVPPISWCYFAPAIGQYKTLSTSPIKIRVTPSEEGSRMVVVGGTQAGPEQQIEILGEDLLPIMAARGRLTPKSSSAPALTLALLIPPVFYAGAFMWGRRRRRLSGDTGYARAYFARSKIRRRLREAAYAPEPAEAVFRALAGYVADRCNVNEAGLTSQEVRALLVQRNVDEEAVESYVKVLRVCERERYAAVRLKDEEWRAVLRGAESAVERLSGPLAGRGRV